MKKADNFNPGNWLVENKITFQSNLNENEEDEQVMINGKEVDLSSIKLDDVYSDDYPDFSDAYILYAEYDDRTPLTREELEKLEDENYGIAQKMALERFV